MTAIGRRRGRPCSAPGAVLAGSVISALVGGFLLLFSLTFALGCGYTWVGASHAGRLGRVAVVVPENASGQGGLEELVADALRREVLRRADAELVEDRSRADWVVSGRVLPLETAPTSFSPAVFALEYELSLALELRARQPDGSEVVPDPSLLRETERYLASSDVEAQRKNREEALRRLSRLLAARFLDALATLGPS